MFDGVGEGLSEEPDQFASFRFAHVFEFLCERFPVNFVESALTDKFRRTHGPAIKVLLMKFGIFGRRRVCQLWSSHCVLPYDKERRVNLFETHSLSLTGYLNVAIALNVRRSGSSRTRRTREGVTIIS